MRFGMASPNVSTQSFAVEPAPLPSEFSAATAAVQEGLQYVSSEVFVFFLCFLWAIKLQKHLFCLMAHRNQHQSKLTSLNFSTKWIATKLSIENCCSVFFSWVYLTTYYKYRDMVGMTLRCEKQDRDRADHFQFLFLSKTSSESCFAIVLAPANCFAQFCRAFGPTTSFAICSVAVVVFKSNQAARCLKRTAHHTWGTPTLGWRISQSNNLNDADDQ